MNPDTFVPDRLRGRVAIITGAAQGLGLAIATRFVREGAKVVMADLQDDKLAAAAKALGGSDVAHIAIDITAADAPERIVGLCEQRYGGVDILVNNAGIAGSLPVAEEPEDHWRRMLDVDLTASFRLAKRALPLLMKSPHGRVINISSMLGLVGMRYSSSYAAAKAGIVALTKSMAADYGVHGVTSNAIAPGPIDTPLARNMIATRPAWYRHINLDGTAIRRMGQAADVAAAASFFASDDAGYITAQVLSVDGGWANLRYLPDEMA